MLQETEAMLAKVSQQNKIKQIQQGKKKYLVSIVKKYFLRTSIAVSILLIVFFPKSTATVIGHWIADFFGTIYITVNQSVTVNKVTVNNLK